MLYTPVDLSMLEVWCAVRVPEADAEVAQEAEGEGQPACGGGSP